MIRMRQAPNRHAGTMLTTYGGRRRSASIAWLAALLATMLAAAGAHASATASRTVTLNETGRLHRTGRGSININQTLNEQGTATGTISGAIYIHLRFPSFGRVSAEVNIYPRGGSITGTAGAAYRSSGATATFKGTLNVIRGTGTYGHAHGNGLSFTGTVQRSNDAVTVHVSGRMSD